MALGKKTLLVIGCGYLGERVVSQAKALGWTVYATTRSRPEVLARLGCNPVICDVTDPNTYKALPLTDGVVYCVGMDRNSGKSLKEVYVHGLKGVAAHLKNSNFSGRFIHVSSTSVYPQEDGNWVNENSPTNPKEGSGPTILEAEKAISVMIPTTIILRFAGIYGPGRLIRSKALLSGEPIVCDPDRWLNLIHVEDGASATLSALVCQTWEPVVNICDDEPAKRRDFYDTLAGLLGAAPPRYQLPEPGTPAMAHEGSNRRISNTLMKARILPALKFPTFRQGLSDCVKAGAFA